MLSLANVTPPHKQDEVKQQPADEQCTHRENCDECGTARLATNVLVLFREKFWLSLFGCAHLFLLYF
jgi:ferredoxin-like protein FixX